MAKTTRRPKPPAANSPEGRSLGLDDRDIPGGLHHLVQAETVPADPAVPARPPEFSGDMAHGVPADRDEIIKPADKPRHHGSKPVRHELPPPEPDPVPVYMVERRGRVPVRRELITRAVTVVAAGGEPTRVASEDRQRSQLRMFNEAASGGNVIRFASTQAALAGVTATATGDGAALEPQAWSPKLETHGDVWAVSQAATATAMTVLIETEIQD